MNSPWDKTNIEVEHIKMIHKAMNNIQNLSTNLDNIYYGVKARKLQEYINNQEDLQVKNINLRVEVIIEVKPIVDN